MRINTNYCIFVTFVSQFTIFIPMGFSASVMNPIDDTMSHFINETFKVRWNMTVSADEKRLILTLAESMLIVGSLVGAFAAKFTLQLMSRKSNMIAIHLVSVISYALMSPVAWYGKSYEVLIVGRFINGIARGIGFTVASLIVAETTNKATLAFHQAPTVIMLMLGSALGNGLGHPAVLGGINTWPYLLVLTSLFSLAYLCLIPWIPHTPTYLILQEHSNQLPFTDYTTLPSFQLLRLLRHGNLEILKTEYEDLRAEILRDLNISKASLLDMLRTKHYRQQFFRAVIIYFSFQSTAIQAIVLYSDLMFKEAGMKSDLATFSTVGLFVLMAVISLASIPVLSRFGSRKMMLFGLSLTTLALCLLTVCIETKAAIPIMSDFIFVALFIYALGISSGPMLCYAGLASEITSQVIRPIALWSGGICYYVMASTIAFVTPYTMNSLGGYTYLFFVGLLLFDILYIKFCIPQNIGAPFSTSLEFQAARTKKEDTDVLIVPDDRMQA